MRELLKIVRCRSFWSFWNLLDAEAFETFQIMILVTVVANNTLGLYKNIWEDKLQIFPEETFMKIVMPAESNIFKLKKNDVKKSYYFRITYFAFVKCCITKVSCWETLNVLNISNIFVGYFSSQRACCLHSPTKCIQAGKAISSIHPIQYKVCILKVLEGGGDLWACLGKDSNNEVRKGMAPTNYF